MRLLGRLLCILLFVWFGYFAVIFIEEQLKELNERIEMTADDARASTYFAFRGETWLVFPVLPADQQYRFYFHAALMSPDETLNYDVRLEYQWLNDADEVLEQGDYHMALHPRPLVMIDNGEATQLLPSRFYTDKATVPSSDLPLYLDTAGINGATELRLRIAESSPGVQHVGVRAYLRKRREQDKLEVVWQRMSQATRERISEPSIYPPELLTRFERNNALDGYWEQIGPKGRYPEDIDQRTLYLRRNGVRWRDTEELQLAGHYASYDKTVSFVIETAGSYRIQSIPATDMVAREARVIWQGGAGTSEWQQVIELDGQGEWQAELQPGLLSWTPDSPMTLTLMTKKQEQWVDITPPRRFSKSYLCQPGTTLEYALAPGEAKQPLLLRARSFERTDMPESTASLATLAYVIRDREQKVLLSGNAETTVVADVFRQFSDAAKIPSRINEAQQVFVRAPAASASMHIDCAQPLLISLATRPAGLPVVRQYPRDQRPWWQHKEKIPLWFGVQPKMQDGLTSVSYSLVWYSKPLVGNPAIEAGNYTWEWLYAAQNENPLERQMLSLRDDEGDVRREARTAVYHMLGNKPYTFRGSYDQTLLRPDLIYLRDTSKREQVTVFVDGVAHDRITLNREIGKTKLTALRAGPHNLQFSSAHNAKWLVNQVDGATGSHILRSAYYVRDGSLSLDLPLNGQNQMLSLWFYLPRDAAQQIDRLDCQASLRVRQAQTVLNARTFDNYEFRFDSLDTYTTAHPLQGSYKEHTGPLKSTILLRNLPTQKATITIDCDTKEWLLSAGTIAEGAQEYDMYQEWLDGNE